VAWDTIVVGAGPAGITAARTLLEAGRGVCLVDAGEQPAEPPPQAALATFRQELGRWRWFLGEGAEALKAREENSPKLRTPVAQRILEGYEQALQVQAESFRVVGCMAPGGLSNLWGAGVACFNETELRGWPVRLEDLREGYDTVARRIGVSGSSTDDLADFFGKFLPLQPPLPLDQPAETVYRRYQQRRAMVRSAGLTLGRSRNAVLTQPLGQREACTRCGFCLYGCGYQAIYNASEELEELKGHPAFSYFPGLWAERLETTPDGPRLTTVRRGSGERQVWTARAILLACGTLATTRLVLGALGWVDRPVRLLSQPAVGFALWVPRDLAGPYPERFFGLAQLSFTATSPGEGKAPLAAGNVFLGFAVPLWDLASRLPLPPRLGYRLLRDLLPSLLLGNAFLSADVTEHSLTLGSDGVLRVRGHYRPELDLCLPQVVQILRKGFRRAGAWLLPGSLRLATPGADVHYAGTLPHSARPALGQTDPMGAVAGLPGVYVVDASVLPSLPPKAHTFTVMANAHRIAAALGKQYRGAAT